MSPGLSGPVMESMGHGPQAQSWEGEGRSQGQHCSGQDCSKLSRLKAASLP